MYELAFRFRDQREVERFIEFVEKHVKVPFIVKTRLNYVYIQLQGDNVKDAVTLVKKLAKLAKSTVARRQVPLLVLFQDAELERPVPPEAIADALTLAGYWAQVRGEVLETDADYETVLQAAEELSRLYAQAENLRITPHAKRLAVAYAWAKKIEVAEAVEELIAKGILGRGAVVSLKWGLEEARKRLFKIFKEESSGGHDVA